MIVRKDRAPRCRARRTAVLILSVVCSSVFHTRYPPAVEAFSSVSHGPTGRKRVATAKDDLEQRLRSQGKNNDNLLATEKNMAAEVQDRRRAMATISTAVLASIFATNPAVAYDREFPTDLDTSDAVLKPLLKSTDPVPPKPSALELPPLDLGIGSFLWAGALWLLAGSRSNPLATPLANLLYNEQDEQWLQDRNEGLFAALPVPLLLVMSLVFGAFGFGAHVAAITLSGGSIDYSLQLAGVLLIGAGSLELGRIASGEKGPTREENNRDLQLESEFAEFAERRLQAGGNVHRSEVVKAFRRYFAKYRQVDSEEYPLNDLEIEQLLRQWNEKNLRAQRSAAGFYTGLQINTDADVFV